MNSTTMGFCLDCDRELGAWHATWHYEEAHEVVWLLWT